MDKVQKCVSTYANIPSSETYRSDFYKTCVVTFIKSSGLTTIRTEGAFKKLPCTKLN
jgi:hypothetical protein